MAVPLIAREQVIGLMAVWRDAPGRRFTEAVLSGVSAGVVGMDGHGRVDIVRVVAFVK